MASTLTASVTRFGEISPLWQNFTTLAKFHHFGKIIIVLGNFQMLYLDSKMLNLLWKYKFAVGHVFIIVNGQILNKLPSHLVALLTAFSAEQSSFIISIINRPKYFLRFVTIYDGPRHVLLLIFVVCDTSGGCEPNLRSFCLGHFCTRQMPI